MGHPVYVSTCGHCCVIELYQLVSDGIDKEIIEVTVTWGVVGCAGTVLQVDETFGHKKPEVRHEPATGPDSVQKTEQLWLSKVSGRFCHCAAIGRGAYKWVGRRQ